MKSTTYTTDFNAPFPASKLELSKYRRTQPNTSTKKQSQAIAKPSPFQSKKNSIAQQKITRKSETRHSTGKSGQPNILAHRPSFSIFFPKEDESVSGIPSYSEVTLQSEGEITDKDSEKKQVVKRKTIEVVQPKELSRNAKNQSKVQVWSFLDLSDKEDEGSLNGNSTVFGSRKSLRNNTEQTLATSYVTTMPDEEMAKEDNRRCVTESSDFTSKAETYQTNMENMMLKSRVKELEEKNGKWELFGRLLTKCYQATRKERNEYKMQNGLDKKTIAALKEQVGTLKTISKTEKANAAKALKKASQDSEETQVLVFALRALEIKLGTLSNENKELKEQIALLQQEKENQKPEVNTSLNRCASRKKVTFWEPTDDIDTPSPRPLQMKPLVKENDLDEIVD